MEQILTVDARGYSCPIPVVMVKKAARESRGGLLVLVDNACSMENVTRFGENNGYRVTVERPGGRDYALTLAK